MNKDDDYYEGIEDQGIRTRHKFVRKVLGIVAVQLFVTTCIVSPFVFVDEVKFFALAQKNFWIPLVCMVILIALMLALGCSARVRHSYPLNVILLGIFTIVKSISLGFFVATKYPMHVLFALGITVILCTVLILFALQTKWDFTSIWPFLLVGCVILLLMGIVSIFFRNRIFLIVMCSFGVLLFSIYLIVDVQMILTGKHKYGFAPEDYIIAALSIYVDIITIFVYILSLLGLTWGD